MSAVEALRALVLGGPYSTVDEGRTAELTLIEKGAVASYRVPEDTSHGRIPSEDRPARYKKSEDPAWWYVQATCYHEAFKVLVERASTMTDGPAVFLLAVATELYLKSFLLAGGYTVEQVKDFGHDLQRVRSECLQRDSRFDDESIRYVADQLGPWLTERGGVRYPVDFGGAGLVFPHMPRALEQLGAIAGPLFLEEAPAQH